VKAPARLDWNKLAHINNHYIRLADDDRLADLVLPILEARGVDLPTDARSRLVTVLPLIKEGAKTVQDLADLSLFAVKRRPLALDEKGVSLLTEETRALLARLAAALATESDWTPGGLGANLRAFASSEGVGLGKFGAALRATLSGGASAPDLAGALTALGKSESLGRIEDALSQSR
jgi:glutamyl-tRNA synthetase